jgi:hydroxymethylpyrimidine kinase/phosphomethylpyrimidine kinase
MDSGFTISLMKNILLSVAGFDPTSGAGVSLDLKVFEFLGFQGMAVLTSLTSQNTERVKKVHCILPEFLEDQYETLKADVSISGIKVGMVGCGENIPVIKKILRNNPDVPRIVDPVFKSSSGAWLTEQEAIPDYISDIKGNISLLTPNMEEANLISGIKIRAEEDMKKASILSSLLPVLSQEEIFKKRMSIFCMMGRNFIFSRMTNSRKMSMEQDVFYLRVFWLIWPKEAH